MNGLQDEASYEVHTALREDLNEGWVWIENSRLETHLNHRRRIVRISRRGRSVYCEALYLDNYYVRRFNKERGEETAKIVRGNRNLIFINGWYRRNLGISAVGTETLSVAIGKSFRWQMRALLQHPQVGVFLTTVLAIIGVGLAVMGVGLGIISVKDLWYSESGMISAVVIASAVLVVIGLVIVGFALIKLLRRARAA